MLPKYETLVEEIKTKRREKGWSQKTLARRADVSKSLVGKLERKDNIPNYKNVRAIYRAVQERDNTKQAEQFVTKNIVSAEPDQTIKEAADIMNNNDFSQMPVEHQGNYIGLITSQDIAIIENRETKVNNLRYHSLPIIPHDTPKGDFKLLLNTHKAVLVTKNNKPIGIITSANLL